MAPGKLRSGGARTQRRPARAEMDLGSFSVSQDLLGWQGNSERRETFYYCHLFGRDALSRKKKQWPHAFTIFTFAPWLDPFGTFAL